MTQQRIQEKTQAALDYVLEEIGNPLVATESFRADAGRITSAFDLGLLDGQKQRDIKVDLRLPSRKELMKLTLLRMAAQGEQPQDEEVPQVIAALHGALDAYYTGDAAKAWQTQVRHGETTITFEGIPHDAKHILNTAHADILRAHPFAQGANPRVMQRLHPQASEQQIQVLNQPDNVHSLMAVNGYPLLNYQQKDVSPRAKFAHAVEMVESMERVNDTEGLLLHPYIKLGRVDGAASTFAVNNFHQVLAGSVYFGKDKLPPEGAVHAALLHENYHVLNGDFKSPSQQMARRIPELMKLNAIELVCRGKPEESAEAFLQAGEGTLEGARTVLRSVNNLLDDVWQTVQPMSAQIEAVQGLTELGGRGLVADIEGEQKYQPVLDAVAATELPMQSIAQFDKLTRHVIEQGKQKPAGELAAEDVATIQQEMQAVFKQHAPLFAAVKTMHGVGRALSHASEMLADKRALPHMDSPENLVQMLDWSREGRSAPPGMYSHPGGDERNAAIREWGAELKARQAIAARQQGEKPVLGAATAALSKRATEQSSPQR